MEYDEEEFDKTKYFLTPNKEKIYARKGQGHKGLAYSILNKNGLDMLYYSKYEGHVPAAIFLTYCGYVIVDEGEEKREFGLFEDKVTKFTSVGYCSASIDEEYIEYLKRKYGNSENIIDDIYDTEDKRIKNMIDEITQTVKKKADRQRDDNER